MDSTKTTHTEEEFLYLGNILSDIAKNKLDIIDVNKSSIPLDQKITPNPPISLKKAKKVINAL